MSDHDDDHEPMPRGFMLPLPGAITAALADAHQEHDRMNARAEERHASTLRWVEELDGEGLLCLRYVLAVGHDAHFALSNAKWWEGMTYALLRAKGLDPTTGEPFGAKVLPGLEG